MTPQGEFAGFEFRNTPKFWKGSPFYSAKMENYKGNREGKGKEHGGKYKG